MSHSLTRAGLVAALALFAMVALGNVGQQLAPGTWSDSAWAGEKKPRQRARRQPPQGSSPEEIARYFQLYGGYIDPEINKQSQGGPFDSGFFFDSGISQNGGDSPYMN